MHRLKIAVRVVEYQVGKRFVTAFSIPMMQDEILLIRNRLLTGWAKAVLYGVVDACFCPPKHTGRQDEAVKIGRVGLTPIRFGVGDTPELRLRISHVDPRERSLAGGRVRKVA